MQNNPVLIEDGIALPKDEVTAKKSSEEKKSNRKTKANILSAAQNPGDLAAPGVAKAMAKAISDSIDAYCVDAYDDGHRKHLGASVIGDDCSRKLWYIFRWCYHKKFDGRMQRLFNRGHREEDRFVEWLEGIGCKVYTHDYTGFMYHPESESYFIDLSPTEETMMLSRHVYDTDPDFKYHVMQAKFQGIEFPQIRGVLGVGGHFGGSLDAVIILPPEFGYDKPLLGEFKTNGTGPGFVKMQEDGMPVAKPMHFAQVSTYGKYHNFEWCLYMNINKNDDSIHIELVKLDHSLGERCVSKAERIIMSPVPPPRLSDNPTFKTCQYCDYRPVCHENLPVEKNCRSCRSCEPKPDKQWFCHVHNDFIPADVIPVGCNNHSTINV